MGTADIDITSKITDDFKKVHNFRPRENSDFDGNSVDDLSVEEQSPGTFGSSSHHKLTRESHSRIY